MPPNKARPPQSPPAMRAENKVRPSEPELYVESTDKYHVPPEIIPDGMTYEWKALTVLGQEQLRRLNEAKKAGWSYVPRSRHLDDIPSDSVVPAGFDGMIVVDGLVLMERSTELTNRYRARDERVAREQTGHQFERLKLVPDGTMGGQRPGEGRSVTVNRERDLSIPSDAGGD